MTSAGPAANSEMNFTDPRYLDTQIN